jgi:hypothetical protein
MAETAAQETDAFISPGMEPEGGHHDPGENARSEKILKRLARVLEDLPFLLV